MGNYYYSSSEENSLAIYDCLGGKKLKELYFKNLGVGVVKFTHDNNSIISSSNNLFDFSLTYWSHYDNQILRYFKGHNDVINSISMSPANDLFFSSSNDGVIKKWVLDSNDAVSSIKVNGIPYTYFSPESKVLGIAIADRNSRNNQVRLYDMRKIDGGPFAVKSYDIKNNTNLDKSFVEFNSIKFGPLGKYIMCTTNENLIYILNANDLNKIVEITDFVNDKKTLIEASFTPDESFILVGGEDGYIRIFELPSGKKLFSLEKHHDVVRCIKFNYNYMMMVTSDKNLLMWIPTDTEEIYEKL